MRVSDKHYEILAEIKLYDSSRGRRTFIANNYRPNIYFGLTEPNNPNYASDCIIKLINQNEIYPGQTATVKIYVLKYFYMRDLLVENAKLKIKEGPKFVGEGVILNVIGERSSIG